MSLIVPTDSKWNRVKNWSDFAIFASGSCRHHHAAVSISFDTVQLLGLSIPQQTNWDHLKEHHLFYSACVGYEFYVCSLATYSLWRLWIQPAELGGIQHLSLRRNAVGEHRLQQAEGLCHTAREKRYEGSGPTCRLQPELGHSSPFAGKRC